MNTVSVEVIRILISQTLVKVSACLNIDDNQRLMLYARCTGGSSVCCGPVSARRLVL